MLHRRPEDPWRDGLFAEIHFHIPSDTWFDSRYMYMRKSWDMRRLCFGLKGQELSRSFPLSNHVTLGWRDPSPKFQLSCRQLVFRRNSIHFLACAVSVLFDQVPGIPSTSVEPSASSTCTWSLSHCVLSCMLPGFSLLCDDAPFCVVHRLECIPRERHRSTLCRVSELPEGRGYVSRNP